MSSYKYIDSMSIVPGSLVRAIESISMAPMIEIEQSGFTWPPLMSASGKADRDDPVFIVAVIQSIVYLHSKALDKRNVAYMLTPDGQGWNTIPDETFQREET